MEKAALMKKIGVGFLCLIVVALLGFSIYQHRLLKEVSTAEDINTAANEPDAGNTPGPETEMPASGQAPRVSVPESQHEIANADAIEAKLDATESELDAAYQQLDDEMSRKEALAQKQQELQRQFMNSPAFRNTIRSIVDNRFKDVFDELNLSEGEREKFTEIYVEYFIANSEFSPEIASASTDAQKDDLRQRYADMIDSRESQLKDLLGSDYETYHEYAEMATTRSIIDQFTAALSPENKLTEAQEKEITEIMYKEQMRVFDEMGYDPRYEIEFPSDVKDGSADGQANNMAKIHSRTEPDRRLRSR